jgi:hypothetical protein
VKKGLELAAWVVKHLIRLTRRSTSPRNNAPNMGVEVVKLHNKSESKEYQVVGQKKTRNFPLLRDAKAYRAKIKGESKIYVTLYFNGFIYSKNEIA